jgi:hypothetical protein
MFSNTAEVKLGGYLDQFGETIHGAKDASGEANKKDA